MAGGSFHGLANRALAVPRGWAGFPDENVSAAPEGAHADTVNDIEEARTAPIDPALGGGLARNSRQLSGGPPVQPPAGGGRQLTGRAGRVCRRLWLKPERVRTCARTAPRISGGSAHRRRISQASR